MNQHRSASRRLDARKNRWRPLLYQLPGYGTVFLPMVMIVIIIVIVMSSLSALVSPQTAILALLMTAQCLALATEVFAQVAAIIEVVVFALMPPQFARFVPLVSPKSLPLLLLMPVRSSSTLIITIVSKRL